MVHRRELVLPERRAAHLLVSMTSQPRFSGGEFFKSTVCRVFTKVHVPVHLQGSLID